MERDLDSLIKKYDVSIVELALRARDLVLKTVVGVREEIDLPANMLAYGLGPGYKGAICTLIFSKKQIKMGFYKAVELPDPAALFRGAGKVHKYVELNSEKDLENPDLLRLLKAAEKACRERLESC